MTEIVRFSSQAGDVLVEVDEQEDGGIRRAGRGEQRIVEAAASLDEAIGSVLPAATRMFEVLEQLKPASAQLEFGVKLSGEFGGLIAKAGGEAQLNVTLTWEPRPKDPESEDPGQHGS